MKRHWLIIPFIIAQVLIFSLAFGEGGYFGHPHAGGSQLYLYYSSRIVDGELPYRDFDLEYPPLALAAFSLPRIFASTPSSYGIAFAAEMLLLELLGLVLIYGFTRRLKQSPWAALSVYTLALLAIGPIIGERYDVMVQMEEEARRIPSVIDDIHIRSADGMLVPLSSVVRVAETVGPGKITRFNRNRNTVIQANLEGLPLQAALEETDRIADEILPADFETAVTGQTEEMEESFASLSFALILAVLIIYMVLASQFNHFVHPFTIMIALPLSMVGALYSLYLFGMTINLFSIIGIIVLMGLVTKNSILLVDYTNQLRDGGAERREAVIRAGRVRLRPILMTAISMIFGVLPAAVGLGAGSESRRPMAIATAGGMLASTLLTLFVVPAVYLILDDMGLLFEWVRKKVGGSPK